MYSPSGSRHGTSFNSSLVPPAPFSSPSSSSSLLRRVRGGLANKLLLLYALVASLLLFWQTNRQSPLSTTDSVWLRDTTLTLPAVLSSSSSTQQAPAEASSVLFAQQQQQQQQQQQLQKGWDPANPLVIPTTKAQNLPSIRVEDAALDKKRKIYGGVGDQKHLGGFTELDLDGISPAVWTHMIQSYGVHSVLDVGCGRGISTLWFLLHGVESLCVEGSHDAVQRTILPDPEHQIVEHDFSRGPWWPDKTYDACWAVEFLEHVSYVFFTFVFNMICSPAFVCWMMTSC